MANSYEDLKDVRAETAVISSLLNHPEFILYSENLDTEHFTQKENSAIYWAIKELYKQGITNIDELNLNNQLSSNKAVSKLMSAHNLSDISKYMDLAKYAARDTIEEYLAICNTVISLAYKRELFKKSAELQRLCFSDKEKVEEIDTMVHRITNALTSKYLVMSELKSIGDQADDLLQEIIDKQTEEGFGVPSKYSIYNPYFQFETGELIVVASRMKSGKTADLLNEAVDKAQKGIPTVVFDTELTDRMWYTRVLAHLSQVTVRRIKEGNWSTDERSRIMKANELLKSLPLMHIYMPIVDIDRVYAICKILKYKMGLKFVCFDYIKGNDTDAFALSNKLGQITDVLKNEIAGELDMMVLAACQLSRSNEISSSDKIAMYASTIIYWRFKTASEIAADGGLDYGNIYTRIYINRNGAQQDEGEWMNLRYVGDTQTITDCKQNVREEPFGGA